MTHDPFTTLKKTCHDACHERHACAEGYRQMLATENISQMMATWRNNWEDIVQGKFADIIIAQLPKQYPHLKQDMNQAGIYLNECPDNAPPYVKIIITDTDTPLNIYGDAKAYILGTATVIAHDHSQIYNTHGTAIITLLDRSYGNLKSTDKVETTRFAKLTISNEQ